MAFNPKEHMTNLRGKEYLETKWRVVWFRDEHPQGQILTELLNVAPLIMKATIVSNDGGVLGTGHGSAEPKQGAVWAGREIEKAETAAIGRALGHAGYGTQFSDEDEGDHLADSPVQRGNGGSTRPTPPSGDTPRDPQPSSNGNGTHAADNGGTIQWPSASALNTLLSHVQRATDMNDMSMAELARLAGIKSADDLGAWSTYVSGKTAYDTILATFESEQKPAAPVVKSDTKIEAINRIKVEAYGGKNGGMRMVTASGSCSYTRQPFRDVGIECALWDKKEGEYTLGGDYNVISMWHQPEKEGAQGYWKIDHLDTIGKAEAELFPVPEGVTDVPF